MAAAIPSIWAKLEITRDNMAIYQNNGTFYLNGVADPVSQNVDKTMPAHEFNFKNIRTLLRIYFYSFLAQCVLTIPTLGIALIRKVQLNPLSFESTSLLAALISTPVFIAWASTLVLRRGVTTFSLSTVEYQTKHSLIFYCFYALAGLNLLIIFISAPWGEGWYMPFSIVPPVSLFFVVVIMASTRALRLRKSSA